MANSQKKTNPPLVWPSVGIAAGSGLLSALLFPRRDVRRLLLRRLGSRRLSFRLFQLLSHGVHKAGLVHQYLANDNCALVGFLPLVFFHRLAHCGNRLDAVAGVSAGSIDLVFEPRPLLEPLTRGERP